MRDIRATAAGLELMARDEDGIGGAVPVMARELIAARARIAELEQAWEAQVSEIADKGESITRMRERLRGKNNRIIELERDLHDAGNSAGRLADQLRASCTQGADAAARVAELEKFAGDLADHGTRHDLNPTMDCRDVNTVYGGMSNYMRRIDGAIRRRAAEVLGREVQP